MEQLVSPLMRAFGISILFPLSRGSMSASSFTLRGILPVILQYFDVFASIVRFSSSRTEPTSYGGRNTRFVRK